MIEACVGSLAEALAAQRAGADRVELCSALDLEGLSPTLNTVKTTFKQLSIPIRVMVRPHAKSFCYSPQDIKQMIKQIEACKIVGVEGVVLGCLTTKNEVDLETTQLLATTAHPLKVVFHKAIDLTPNVIDSTQQLMEKTSIDAILTSGGADTAQEGLAVLQQLYACIRGRLELVVAGKVRPEHIKALQRALPKASFHGKNILKQV